MTRAIPVAQGGRLLGQLRMRQRLGPEFYGALAGQYGDVVSFRFGPVRLVAITHPDGLHAVLRERPDRYDKQGSLFSGLASLLGNGLFFSEGTTWRSQRRMLQPGFHPKRTEALRPGMEQQTATLLPELDRAARQGTVVPLYTLMTTLSLRIVANALFGSLLDPAGAQQIAERVLRIGTLIDARVFSPLEALPEWVPLRSRRHLRRAVAELDEQVLQLVAERRAGPPQDDLLGALLTARDDQGNPLDAKAIRDQVMTFFLTGHETTGNALAWTMALLLAHPDVQDAVAGHDGEAHAAAAMQEAMRLYPPGWTLSRRAKVDDELQGFHVPAGTELMLCPYAVHRDPRFFDEPLAFKPERFPLAPEQKRAYLPFGSGPRACIGAGFAMQEGVVALTTLLSRYRFSPVSAGLPGIDPAVTLRPVGGVLGTVELRSGRA